MLSIKYCALALCFCLLSCASGQKDRQKLTAIYLTQTPEPLPNHYHIKDILSRDISMAGGDYKVTVYPYSQALITAMSHDIQSERSLTNKEQQKVHQHLQQTFLNKKTCFHVDTSVLKFQKAASLTNWKMKLIDINKNEYDLKWVKNEKSVKRSQRRGVNRLVSWLNEGSACSDVQVPLNKPFYVKISANYTPFPFSQNALLYWSVYQENAQLSQKLNDKEREKVKKSAPQYKSYRGW